MSSNRTIVRTISGKDIDLLNPDPDLICIEDIAHSLSMQCRYNGMTKSFYSVVEHSILVAMRIGETNGWHDAFCGLMHDAHEAYIGDMIHPLKMIPGIGDEFDKLDKMWMRVISDKFGTTYPHQPIVVKCDMDIRATEMRDLTLIDKSIWESVGIPNEKKITQTMDSGFARHAFLEVFKLSQGRIT